MRPVYGGQAVLEGVMMRGYRHMVVAVRRADGEIILQEREVRPWAERWPGFGLPVLRGVAAVGESLSLGLAALSFSAEQVAEGEGEELSRGQVTVAMAVAVALAVGLFVLLPTWLVRLVEGVTRNGIVLNLVEGIVRLAILLGYLAGVAALPEIRRVLQYHGAEHKAINAYEAGAPLTVESARRFSTRHVRCGTSFLLLVAVVSTVVFAFTGWQDVWARLGIRLALVPLVAGLAYELIRLAGKNPLACPAWLAPVVLPGLFLQGLTTREPDDSQLEVALSALTAAIRRDAGVEAVG